MFHLKVEQGFRCFMCFCFVSKFKVQLKVFTVLNQKVLFVVKTLLFTLVCVGRH